MWVFPKIVGFPPKSSILIGIFHYKPSILGYPYFWKHPCSHISSLLQIEGSSTYCSEKKGTILSFTLDLQIETGLFITRWMKNTPFTQPHHKTHRIHVWYASIWVAKYTSPMDLSWESVLSSSQDIRHWSESPCHCCHQPAEQHIPLCLVLKNQSKLQGYTSILRWSGISIGN